MLLASPFFIQQSSPCCFSVSPPLPRIASLADIPPLSTLLSAATLFCPTPIVYLLQHNLITCFVSFAAGRLVSQGRHPTTKNLSLPLPRRRSTSYSVTSLIPSFPVQCIKWHKEIVVFLAKGSLLLSVQISATRRTFPPRNIHSPQPRF